MIKEEIIDKYSDKEKLATIFKKIKDKHFPNKVILSCRSRKKLCEISSFIINNLLCNHHSFNNCTNKVHSIIENNSHQDLFTIGDFWNKIKKEQIKQLITELNQTSLVGNLRIYLIKGIDLISSAAVNSMLKFLEEEPDNVYGVFLTTNINNVLPTFYSRCAVMSFSNQKKQKENFKNPLILKLIKNIEIKQLDKNYFLIQELKKLELAKLKLFIKELKLFFSSNMNKLLSLSARRACLKNTLILESRLNTNCNKALSLEAWGINVNRALNL